MEQSIKLELPEHIYQLLLKSAQQLHIQLETFIIKNNSSDFSDDPIEQFIGKIESNVSNWTNDHDNYLGIAINEQKLKISE